MPVPVNPNPWADPTAAPDPPPARRTADYRGHDPEPWYLSFLAACAYGALVLSLVGFTVGLVVTVRGAALRDAGDRLGLLLAAGGALVVAFAAALVLLMVDCARSLRTLNRRGSVP